MDRPAPKISRNMQLSEFNCKLRSQLTDRVLVIYSSMFMRFAWKVNPRNMLLFSVHFSNMTLQSNLLIRRILYEWNNPELVAKEKEDFRRKNELLALQKQQQKEQISQE